MKFSEEPFQDGLVPRMNKIIGETDNIGLFCLTRADVVLEESGRCNPLTTGPASFHVWDEESNLCSCGLDKQPDIFTGDHFVDIQMIDGYHVLIEGMPYGFIVYVELIADVLEDQMALMPYHCRTLQEMFRYLVEWSWAYTDLGSQEEVARVAHGMLISMNFPDEMRQWIIDSVPFEKLGRFLRGDLNANERTIEEIPPLRDDIDEWLHDKIVACRSLGEYDD
jgi:hypothetical protein